MPNKPSDESANVVELRPTKKRAAKRKTTTTKNKKELGLTREGKPRKNATGRKPKLSETPEVLQALQGLARIQSTVKEMCGYFKVSEPTLHSFLKSSKKAQEAIETGRGEGAISLRRLQFKQAERSTTMSIWLGKQYLGQADKVEENVTANHNMTIVNDAASDFDSRIAGVFARTAEAGDTKLPN